MTEEKRPSDRVIERIENYEKVGDDLMGELFVELATATGERHGIRRGSEESWEHYYGRLVEALGTGSWEHL